MNHFANTISLSLLSKNIKDCSVAELKQLAESYPYAGGLQLLYAEKLKAENNLSFDAQWQKTLLYFNHPLLLQHTFNTVSTTQHKPEEESEEPSNSNTATNPENTKDNSKEETFTETAVDDEKPVSIPRLKIEAIDPEKSLLSYTPYHTVDYFASQGIKLGSEFNATDRFGNQLKSFTSWLKEMRRLPETEIVSKLSRVEQNSVEKMAENSVTGENAITEAMAQVWVKQNNPQKAISIYKKLSLQNPAKNAFFAAKIEHLKKQL